MDIRCTITLFGELRVERGEEVITRFRTQKAASVLAYLALHLQQTHAREKLVDIFWPDMDMDAGRDNLSTALSSLRRQLEPAGTPLGSILLADRQNVRLNPETVNTDVGEFERLLQVAEKTTELNRRAALLEKATALYRGELLPGFYSDWTVREQTRWSDRYTTTLLLLAAIYEKCVEPDAAIAAAQRVIATDPYREDACRLLMRLYAGTGRTSAALDVYHDLEQLLKRELSVTPAPETRRLAERIQNHGEHGETRGKDRLTTEDTERHGESQKSQYLKTRTPEDPNSEIKNRKSKIENPVAPALPLQLTRFFGREREIERLRELLLSGNRLVSILGPGGTGKTRIALEVAEQVKVHYEGRVWFVSLADIPDPGLIPSTLIHALKLPPAPNVDPLERIEGILGDRPCLFVLDNFEHLLRDATLPPKCDNAALTGSPALVRMLLERIPGLTCLVTSRQALHIGGEIEYALPALALPETATTPESLLQSASVALYVDRARAAKPDFALTEGNAAAVAALCRKLEGMPLAIEMAAAWARTLPPARVLERLEHQLDLLVSRRRDMPPRHQSLRAAIEWSYSLLSEEQQVGFERLSVFRGGWTLEAAEAVCGSQALMLLDELMEQSLLLCEDREEETRYRMLAPLREYAAEKLAESGSAESTAQTHTAYFLSLANQAAQHYLDANVRLWLDRLDREHDNLRAALGWSLAQAPDCALRLGSALWKFWEMRGHIAEGRTWLERALAAGEEASPKLRADALNGAGMLACRQGDFGPSRTLHERSLSLREAVGDKRGIAASLHSLGIVATQQGDYSAARDVYVRSLEISREIEDEASIAGTLNNLGNVAEIQGDFEAARRYHEESLERARRLGNAQSIAIALTNLGRTAFRQGAHGEARDFQQQSLYLSRELGYKRVMRYALQGLGDIACAMGDFEAARDHYAESVAISREIGFKQGLLESLIGFATAAAMHGDGERAERLFGAAESLRLALGVTNPPYVQAEIDRHLNSVRSSSGPAAFSPDYLAGRSLSLDAALEYALSVSSLSS